MTDFFQSTKSPSLKQPYKKPEDPPKNAIEEITQTLRGNSVKILWLPKLHYELDPSQYVSVFLLNEISLRLKANEDVDLKTHCIEALDRLPDGIWELAVELVNKCEASYMDFDGNADSDETENKSAIRTESEDCPEIEEASP